MTGALRKALIALYLEAPVSVVKDVMAEVEAALANSAAERDAAEARAEYYKGRDDEGAAIQRELEARLAQATHTHQKESTMEPLSERFVVVTTAHKGVFGGYATDTSGPTIKLRAARNCLYWPAEVGGFLGLAATGPKKSARVGPAVDIELRDITCVAFATPEATAAWSTASWK